jgi:hypothetical protein
MCVKTLSTWCKRAVTLRLNTALRLPRYRGIHTRTDTRVLDAVFLNFLLTQTFLPLDSLARLLITSPATFPPCAKFDSLQPRRLQLHYQSRPSTQRLREDTSDFRARYQYLCLRKSTTSTSIANSISDIDIHSQAPIATSLYAIHTSPSCTSTTTSHTSTLPLLTSKQHTIPHPAADIPSTSTPMSSRTPTLSLTPPPAPKPPGPPAAHFRAIRTLSSSPMASETLCLPRVLHPVSPPPDVFTSLSSIHAAHVPSLMVVRMNIDQTVLRAEFADLDARGVVLRSQFTGDATSSFVSVRPVASIALAAFGARMNGIPGWMLAHILLGILLNAENGVRVKSNGVRVKSDGVALEMCGEEEVYVYRGYPIVRVDAVEDGGVGETTARSVLRLLREVIVEWNDVASYLASAGRVGQRDITTNEPVLLVLRDVQALLEMGDVSMEYVFNALEGQLVDIRHEGPDEMPESMLEKLHVDLVTDDEMRHALRKPTVLRRFVWKINDFRAIVTNEKVVISVGGFAGKKTNRILVVRFGTKKDAFLRAVGEGGYADTDAEADDELTMPEGESEDGEFDWDDSTMFLQG